jgi:hypothetical protein
MTVFLCIAAIIALFTEIRVGTDMPGYVLPVTFALKVGLVLGLAYLALQSYWS